VSQTLPPQLKIQPLADQSVFVRAAVSGVVREAIIAACLTGAMILLFLGSWRSTLIIAVSIPLSILASVIALSALGETIHLMTLGGLALPWASSSTTATVETKHQPQLSAASRPGSSSRAPGAGRAPHCRPCALHRILPMFFHQVAWLSICSCPGSVVSPCSPRISRATSKPTMHI
jgi:hypothetical protein